MPFLVVTGTARWIAVESPSKTRCFEPGIHEVSEEIAALARAPGTPARVFVSAERPELAPRPDGAPLTLEDIRLGVDYGVRLRQNDAPADPEDEGYADPERVPDAYPCEFCTRSFATGERLDWHIEFAHSIHHEHVVAEQETEPAESAAIKEIDDRLAQARPEELHPAERKLLDG